MIEDLVTFKRSKRAKRLALRLDPVERIINLVVPNKMSAKRAYAFAQGHEKWVRKTLSNLPEPHPFTHGAALPFMGNLLTLNIHHDPSLRRTTIKQDTDILHVNTYQDNPTNRITTHLKKQARISLADIASEKAQRIERAVSSITVRETKSRWGSCASDGALSFSWRLIFAPYAAIDYVVAHEVAHLIHMNHSKDFWTLCDDLSEDYITGKKWMKTHSNILMCYGKIS